MGAGARKGMRNGLERNNRVEIGEGKRNEGRTTA